MTTQQKETILACGIIGFVFLLVNIFYVKWYTLNIEMNGTRFVSVGMLEYPNKDGKKLYIPLYQRKN